MGCVVINPCVLSANRVDSGLANRFWVFCFVSHRHLMMQKKAEREKLRVAHTLKQASEELESKRGLQAAHAARTGNEFSV